VKPFPSLCADAAPTLFQKDFSPFRVTCQARKSGALGAGCTGCVFWRDRPDASNDSVVVAYEKRIAKLEREKLLALEKMSQAGKPLHTFDVSFEHAMRFLASPWKIWENDDLVMKQTVLRLAFSEPLPYCRNDGLRTPNLAFPFKALDGFCGVVA